ncbi:MAG TPA: SBBP repeat-containing protein, partial [Bryobacteraceae bacterium]|nr:SBBP repeat-containing protein [Bryobacteraceae bacterium]
MLSLLLLAVSYCSAAILQSATWGGRGLQQATGIARDGAGNTYVVGWTDAPDFPVHNSPLSRGSGVDGFLIKLDPSWNAVLTVWLGGDGDDRPSGVGLDATGNIYVAGTTTSSAFAGVTLTRAAPGHHGFIAKLSPSGALSWVKAVGGSGEDYINSMAVARDGHVYAGGVTNSGDLPLLGALQSNLRGTKNGFIAELSTTGALVYSTYLGGGGTDIVNALAIDSSGRLWAAGSTTSSDFPTRAAFQQRLAGSQNAFVAEISTSSGLVFSTYLGGSGPPSGGQVSEAARAIAIDSVANVYVAGITQSQDFPQMNAWQCAMGGGANDGFLTSFDVAGSLRFSTFLGGDATESINAVIVSNNLVVVAGSTNSDDFPLLSNPQSWNVTQDAFLTEFNTDGSIAYLSTLNNLGQWDSATAMAGVGPVSIAGITASTAPPQRYNAAAMSVPLVSPVSLTLVVSPGSAGSITASPASADGTYLPGTRVCLTAQPGTGSTFQAWSGATLDSSNCITLNSSAVVTATFAQPRYTLKLISAPSSAGTVTANPGPVNGGYFGGTQVCLTAAPAAGWQFVSWSGAAPDLSNCLIITANTAVTATFSQLYTLSLNASPATAGSITAMPAGGSYLNGTPVCLTASAAAGWQFVSWSGAGLDASNCLIVTANATVTANFAPVYTLMLSASPAPGGSLTASPPGGAYVSGTKVCLTAAATSGWQFVSWAGVTLDSLNCLTMTANATVTATFAPVYTLTLSASPAAGGAVTAVPGGPYLAGSSVCLTAAAASGWQFVSWSGAALDS